MSSNTDGIESTSFADSESFTAVPFHLPLTTCGTTTTVTTSASSTSSCVTVQSSSCSPLMWFAGIALTSPKPVCSSVTMTESQTCASETMTETTEDPVISSAEKTISLHVSSDSKKECYSVQSQTSQNLVVSLFQVWFKRFLAVLEFYDQLPTCLTPVKFTGDKLIVSKGWQLAHWEI